MKPYLRSDRVGGQIQKVLSDILRKKVKDPRLKMTVITGVKMSADLKSARVYFANSGGKADTQDVRQGFQSALGYVKRILARDLGLRYMPELKFTYDNSFDYAAKIDQLIKTVSTDTGEDPSEVEKE